MHILVTGAAGMIGRKLTERLAKDGVLHGRAIEKLTLADVFPSHPPPGIAAACEIVTQDLASAGVVSAEAELDFEKGYRSNLDGMRALLEAIRAAGDGFRPKLIFTSSCATFGAPFPAVIDDEFHLTPHTSYGTQKAICELLLADYT